MENPRSVTQWISSSKEVLVGKSASMFIRAVMQREVKATRVRACSIFKKTLVMRDIFIVPQTDTGGLVEKTKANERTMVKELGKKAGRTFGRWPPV
jgi:hypothetical protein